MFPRSYVAFIAGAVSERQTSLVPIAGAEFVVFLAGVDGLESDPMSNQALTPEVFGEVTRRVRALAEEHAGGRLLVLGGGQYAGTGTCPTEGRTGGAQLHLPRDDCRASHRLQCRSVST